MIRRLSALVAFATAVAGCTPASQLRDSDFTWYERSVPISYQQAYRNARAGFRTCFGWYHEGELFDDIKVAEINVWHPTMLNTASPIYHGKIMITPAGEKSAKVKVGLTNPNDSRADQWHRWVAGDTCSG